jgi:hypothetical protein
MVNFVNVWAKRVNDGSERFESVSSACVALRSVGALNVGIYSWQLLCLTSMQGYTPIGTVPTLPLKIWDDSGFEEKEVVLRRFFYEVFTSDILFPLETLSCVD